MTPTRQSCCSGDETKEPLRLNTRCLSVGVVHLDEVAKLDQELDAAKQNVAETKANKLAEEQAKQLAKEAKEAEGGKKADEKASKNATSEKSKKTESEADKKKKK